MGFNLVKFHDGDRYVTAIDVGEARKWKRFLAIDSSGVRVIEVPIYHANTGRQINYRESFVCSVKPKHIRTFRSAGRTFGITKPALEILRQAEGGSK